jgi:peptidyl-prolyl cis-trans isomerase D
MHKIKVTTGDVDAAYDELVQQNGGQEAVDKVLKDLYGIDGTKFKLLIRSQLLRDKVSTELISKVTARHILVRVDSNAPEDQVAAAKTKIEGYLTEIKNGADFGEVAKKSSEDVGSAEQGGLLEPFAQGEMVQAFSDSAFATPLGQISDPVRTEFGWHIIKVEAKTGSIEKSFASWLEEIKADSMVMNFIR